MYSLRLETRRVLSGTLLSESGNTACKPVCYRWHFGKRKLWDYLSCLGYCAGQAGGGKRICTLGICKKRSDSRNKSENTDRKSGRICGRDEIF